MSFIDWIKHPWPWYVAGPLIGLTVPLLLIIGNKSFGISSSLRHICAACIPANIPFFSIRLAKRSLEFIFCIRDIFGWHHCSPFSGKPGRHTNSARTQRRIKSIQHHRSIGAGTGTIVQLACTALFKRVFNDSCRRFFSGFRNKVCRRLYQRPFHHGAFNTPMAFPGSNLLLYGRRLYNGKPNSSIYSPSLII